MGKVKVLKIKSKQLEDRAKTDQRHAKERSDEAVAALARVRKLEESIKQKRQKAMTKILRANKRAIAKDKRAVRDAKQRAEKVGLRAEKKMVKSHKLEAKLARDQKEAGDIFKRATRAREMYKTAQKNTEKAAIRSSKANKAFAKEKYVADLELEKAKMEETQAKNRAALLSREAAVAKAKDGKKVLRAETRARDAVRIAGDEQQMANDVAAKEADRIRRSDRKASAAVAAVMNARTGLQTAREDAKDAQEAATIAAKKAAKSVALAQRVALKLRTAINTAAESVQSENRIIKKNMMVVLPAERRAAAAAWRKAKAANKELAKFQRRVNEGRAVVGKYSADIKLPSFAKTYAGGIDSADKKLRQALASISNVEAPAVPATRD